MPTAFVPSRSCWRAFRHSSVAPPGRRSRHGSRSAICPWTFSAATWIAGGERLRQIVVASSLDPAHTIVNRSFGAQEQYRTCDASLPEFLHDGESVSGGEHHINHSNVVGGVQRKGQTVFAIARPVHGEPCLTQALFHEVSEGASPSIIKACMAPSRYGERDVSSG